MRDKILSTISDRSVETNQSPSSQAPW